MKRNKRGGITTNTIVGIGGLIIAIILISVVVQTVVNANLLTQAAVTTETVTNETFAFANETGYTLAQVNASNSAYTMTAVWSEQNGLYNVSVPLSNVTVSGVGVLTNATVTAYSNLSVSYTFGFTNPETYETGAVTRLRSNWTSGIDNVSGKIPTILLIVAVVFLFGALTLLVRTAKDLGIGGMGSQSL